MDNADLLPKKINPIDGDTSGLWKLFLIWLGLGFQSFGGGASTLILIHQASVKYDWMDEDAFVRAWALSQISPGINLAKLTIIIGFHLRRWRGLLVCTAGLIIPSALITILMTAGYAAMSSNPLMQAAMRGIQPAAIGLSFTMGFQMIQSIFSAAYREGRARFGAHCVLLVGGVALAFNGAISPIMVMLAVGAGTAISLSIIPANQAAARPEAS